MCATSLIFFPSIFFFSSSNTQSIKLFAWLMLNRQRMCTCQYNQFGEMIKREKKIIRKKKNQNEMILNLRSLLLLRRMIDPIAKRKSIVHREAFMIKSIMFGEFSESNIDPFHIFIIGVFFSSISDLKILFEYWSLSSGFSFPCKKMKRNTIVSRVRVYCRVNYSHRKNIFFSNFFFLPRTLNGIVMGKHLYIC